MALINCSDSYNQDVSGCVEYLTFNFEGLDNEDSYYLKLTYANGAQITIDVAFNFAYGYVMGTEFDIDNDNYWNIGTGPVKVELFKTGSCAAEVLTICENAYSSLTLNFIDLQQDADYAAIPCNCN